LDLSDLDDIGHSSFPPRLSSGQRDVLRYLSLSHKKGPGPHQGKIRIRRVVAFLACCFAICVGSVIFAKRISPICGALAFGFIVGVLFAGARQNITFRRRWPLLDSIIDWKLVERLCNEADVLVDRDA
jgi:hypothetical protein